MRIVLLAPLFLPPPLYFEEIRKADLAVIDTEMGFNKRYKSVHRTVINANGSPAFLTVPIMSGARSGLPWSEVKISSHGRWWHVMQQTLATLYGATPYFHLLKNDFFSYISHEAVNRPVTDLDIDLILTILKLSKITTTLSVSLDDRYVADENAEIIDLRQYNFYADECHETSVIEKLFWQGTI